MRSSSGLSLSEQSVNATHCVHLSERDIELIAEAGSPVIHDPTSNMLLASGIAPIPSCVQPGSCSAWAATGLPATTART